MNSEATQLGEQTLIEGVRPVTLGEKLTARSEHPSERGAIQMQSKSPATTAYSMRSAVRKLTC